MRSSRAAALAALALGGCSAAGEAGGERTLAHPGVPFTVQVPADFTPAGVDEENSRGDVVAGVGLDKLDVVAIRRLAPDARLPSTDVTHRVEGATVTSRVRRVAPGWAIECQWRAERRRRVLDACRHALATVARK
jgi:hypothetical protein